MTNSDTSDTVTALICADTRHEARARGLAERLGIPLRNSPPDRGMILIQTADRLELHPNDRSTMGAFWVDFAAGRLSHRSQRSTIRGEGIARAVGMRGNSARTVIDATAGLGRDAFVLATLGARVTMIEASPWVHALLEDGLARARRCASTQAAATRMSLVLGDAIPFLAATTPDARPDVVYMDPMFAERGRRGQVKKDLQILRRLLPAEPDPAPMLRTALAIATERVVVKRPSRAPTVFGPPRSHSIDGNTTRFDVYMIGADRRSDAR